jgi:hypothetical protein
MPDKPLWIDRLPEAIKGLTERTEPWVDRAALESLLGIGRRRAQQVLAGVPNQRIGASLLAGRLEVIAHLQRIAEGEAAHYEHRRRRRLWGRLAAAQPQVLVELPDSQVRRIETHDFAGLPEGVDLAPGIIAVRFRNPDEALEKLMALAMAIGRNRAAFEERVKLSDL